MLRKPMPWSNPIVAAPGTTYPTVWKGIHGITLTIFFCVVGLSSLEGAQGRAKENSESPLLKWNGHERVFEDLNLTAGRFLQLIYKPSLVFFQTVLKRCCSKPFWSREDQYCLLSQRTRCKYLQQNTVQGGFYSSSKMAGLDVWKQLNYVVLEWRGRRIHLPLATVAVLPSAKGCRKRIV